MSQRFVRPASWRGWLVLVCFVAVIIAGIWPVIGWINHPTLVAGLPAVAAWSYLIIFACCGVMALGNRLVAEEDGDDD